MNGLAKTAWIKRKMIEMENAATEAIKKSIKQKNIEEDEIDNMIDHLSDKYNYDPTIYLTNDHNDINAYHSSDRWTRLMGGYSKFMKRHGADDNLNRVFSNHINEYDGSDGIVHSPRSRPVFTHELGHGLDDKEHPILSGMLGPGKIMLSSAPTLAGASAGTGAYLTGKNNEENSYSKNLLTGAGIGAAVGGGLAGLGGSIILRSENAANRNAKKIIDDFYGPEEATKYLEEGRPVRENALKHYKLNNLRVLKNSLIGAGIGSLAGVGLASLAKRPNEKEV